MKPFNMFCLTVCVALLLNLPQRTNCLHGLDIVRLSGPRYPPSALSLKLGNPVTSLEDLIFSEGTNSNSSTPLSYSQPDGDGEGPGVDGGHVAPTKTIVFNAAMTKSKQLKLEPSETGRDILQYLALPGESYSLLQGSEIERVSLDDLSAETKLGVLKAWKSRFPSTSPLPPLPEDLFFVTLPTFKMFGSSFAPSLYTFVTVSPYPAGQSVIDIIHCTLSGGRLAQFANNKFSVDCKTTVLAEKDQRKEVFKITSSVQITCPVPREFNNVLPTRLLGATGSQVMKVRFVVAVVVVVVSGAWCFFSLSIDVSACTLRTRMLTQTRCVLILRYVSPSPKTTHSFRSIYYFFNHSLSRFTAACTTLATVAVAASTGCCFKQGIIRLLLPTFTSDLASDYKLWRNGQDDERNV